MRNKLYKQEQFKSKEQSLRFTIETSLPFVHPNRVIYSVDKNNYYITILDLDEKNKVFPEKTNFEFLADHFKEGAEFLLEMKKEK